MVGVPGFTRREWLILSAIGSVHLFCAICVSIQAPFYPQEAENKGATATEYGLVFGVFEVVALFSSPLFGKYLFKTGAKLTANIGVIVAGSSAMTFGLLHLVNPHTWFITLSFLVRIVESLGVSAATTASFSITALVFPDSVATTFATLEIFYGMGFIVGPTFGGFLFQLGGFTCPFLVLGGLLLLDGAFLYFALPSLKEADEENKPQVNIFSVLKLPPVFLDMTGVTIAYMSAAFYFATLEPHIRQFRLSPFQVGSMFVISGGFYAISAPLVGRLCDTRVCPRKILAFGCVLVVLSFSLVGPLPFLPIDTTLWMCCVGLFLHGVGNACILVSAFIDAIRSALSFGLPDDITTYGIVSGLISASIALGGFIGPSVGGLLLDKVGFRNGTLFVIILTSILFAVTTVFICFENRGIMKDNIGSSSEHLCQGKHCSDLSSVESNPVIASTSIESDRKKTTDCSVDEVVDYGSMK